ncbi:phosphatidylinositol transfer protein 3-like [Oryza brachyantha]|uniref:CRAL-TRIO domain-containing protein n=1 Tax=Oryza brachyantha TaxID=4533 RepID=J3M5D4_ORYBR|nr:phosphatidylinositol transfer protein 3-like [Oryza brachyantha]
MSYLLKAKSWVPTQEKAADQTLDEQQRKTKEVRELLGSLTAEMPAFLTDATIRRFLRAKNWSTEQAAKDLKETVKWRRQYRPETICWEDIPGREYEARRTYIADYHDKNGRTVIISKPAMKSKSSTKDQIKLLVYNLEMLAMHSENEQDECVVWLTDFHGWVLTSTPLPMFRETTHIVQTYYPGLMARAIVSNPPRIFESFWKVVRHFIDPKMKDKVKFVYTNNPESHKMVADMFDLDKLETAFGGRSTVPLDMDKYAERMKQCDQARGAFLHTNGYSCST